MALKEVTFTECQKRGISVVSFGADGDPRELRAMKLSAMFSSQAALGAADMLNILEWSKWFAQQNQTSVAYVQDTVHVAVKLQAKLLKPSTVLPLGRFTGGVHHLLQIQSTFGKDKPGLRNKDISYKDKQNFDAVLHITSECMMNLLSQIPDAQGTRAYLKLMRCIVDSYHDKTLSPIVRRPGMLCFLCDTGGHGCSIILITPWKRILSRLMHMHVLN